MHASRHALWRLDGGSSSEAVEGPALPLEGVDHVHGGHGLALGVLGVGHGVADHVLKEHLGEKMISQMPREIKSTEN